MSAGQAPRRIGAPAVVVGASLAALCAAPRSLTSLHARGYQFAVLGDHDADVVDLVEQVRSLAEDGIRAVLPRTVHLPERMGAQRCEVAGRLLWNERR